MSVVTTVQTTVVTTSLTADGVTTSVDTTPTVEVTVAGGDSVVTEMQGPAGLSAYQIAVRDGFVGSESDWLASLHASGTGTWGSIGGTLSDQTDLAAALAAKLDLHPILLNDLDALAGASGLTDGQTYYVTDQPFLAMATSTSTYQQVVDYDTFSTGLYEGQTWGQLHGTLSDQTDLQAALDAKADLAGAAFTGAISATNLSGTNTGDQDLSSYATTTALTSGLAGKADLTGAAFTGPISTSTVNTTLWSSGTGRSPTGIPQSIINTSATTGGFAGLSLQATSGAVTLQHAQIAAVSSASGYTPNLVFGGANSSTTYAEWARFDTTGKLGIGTTAPARLLHVNGNGQFGDLTTTNASLFIYGTSESTPSLQVSGGTSTAALYPYGLIGARSGFELSNSNIGGNLTFKVSAAAARDTTVGTITSTGLAITGTITQNGKGVLADTTYTGAVSVGAGQGGRFLLDPLTNNVFQNYANRFTVIDTGSTNFGSIDAGTTFVRELDIPASEINGTNVTYADGWLVIPFYSGSGPASISVRVWDNSTGVWRGPFASSTNIGLTTWPVYVANITGVNWMTKVEVTVVAQAGVIAKPMDIQYFPARDIASYLFPLPYMVQGANQVQFGGGKSTHVRLKRVNTQLQVRLGDDSGDADLSARNITASANMTSPGLNLSGAAGSFRQVYFETNGVPRFFVGIDNAAENGNNNGSNFEIYRYSDTGTNLGASVTVNRATGNVSVGGTLTASNLSGTNTGDQDLSSYATTSALTSGLATKLDTSLKGANSGLATLDSSGKLPTSQLPGLALINVYAVSSQAAQDALTVQSGDVVIRSDLSETFIYDGTVWKQVLSPTGGNTAWGTIIGTLSDQADLQSALNAKASLTGAAFTGAISATNLSGTNTGDQTISITGDVTATGSTGALTATVSKINGVALSGLATGILKNTTTTGAPSIAVAADFPVLNQSTTGSAATLTTGRTISLTGDVTATTGTFNGSANVTGAATIAAGAVTLAKMANVATGTLFYRKTAGTGAPEVQTLSTLKTDLGLTGTNSGDQTITLTGDVTGTGTGSFATAIGANKVTRGMLATTVGAAILGATAAGNVADLTGTQATALLDTFTTSLKGLAPASGGGTTNFLRADGTWAAPATSTPTWGSITGTLSSQTDLQTALNAKADASTVVTLAGSQSITGAKTFTVNPNVQVATGTSMLFVTQPVGGRAAIDVGGVGAFDAHFGNHLTGGADLQIHCGTGNLLFYSNNTSTAQLTLGSTGLTATGFIKPGVFTAATLPSASTSGAGAIVYQSDGTAGLYLSDGTAWSTVGAGAGGGTTTNALTLNNSGAGAASGSTFNGSSALTLSYNTIGAAPLASPTFTGTVTASGGSLIVSGSANPGIIVRSNTTTVSAEAYLSFQKSDGSVIGSFGDGSTTDNGLTLNAPNGLAVTTGVGTVNLYPDAGNDAWLQWYSSTTYNGSIGYNHTSGDTEVDGITGVALQYNGVTKLVTQSTGVSVTGTIAATGTVTASNIVQGFGISASGVSTNAGRFPAPGPAPYSYTATAANCSAKALVAATASTVYTIKKGTVASPTTIGTFTFAASGTTATVSITAGSISAGDMVWVEAPATADSTLADISFLIRA